MALRGYLKSLIFKALVQQPMSGYALMNLVEKDTGNRPSAGSIYPLLESLTGEGLLDCEESAHKKVYSLTAKGKKEAQKHTEQVGSLLKQLKETVKMLGVLREIDVSHYIDTIEQDLKGRVPFGTLAQDMDELRGNLYKLNAVGAMEKKTSQVRKILKRANNDLKKLL